MPARCCRSSSRRRSQPPWKVAKVLVAEGCGEAHGFFTSGSLSLFSGGRKFALRQAQAIQPAAPRASGAFETGGAPRECRSRVPVGCRCTRSVPARDGGDHREGDRPRPARLVTRRGRAGYGRRVTHPSRRQLLGFLKLRRTRTAAYRRHGGLFDVSYADGKSCRRGDDEPPLTRRCGASASMRLQRCRVAAGDLAGTALSGGDEGRYDRTRR